jgi:hypothetical protein
MNEITRETRRESFIKVNITEREAQVLEILKDGIERTAREIAEEMYLAGYTNTPDRNNASPRLTDLLTKRYVIIVGKKTDNLTNKSVAIYRIAS